MLILTCNLAITIGRQDLLRALLPVHLLSVGLLLLLPPSDCGFYLNRLMRELATLLCPSSPLVATSARVVRSPLCYTLAGNRVEAPTSHCYATAVSSFGSLLLSLQLLYISEAGAEEEVLAQRPSMVLLGRVHPGTAC